MLANNDDYMTAKKFMALISWGDSKAPFSLDLYLKGDAG